MLRNPKSLRTELLLANVVYYMLLADHDQVLSRFKAAIMNS